MKYVSLLLAAVLALGVGQPFAQEAPALDSRIAIEPSQTSEFVNVSGANMHYLTAGEGDPIVFLHGQPTSSYLWRNIMPFLEDQGQVIAPDLIGFGQSDKPDLDYTFQTHYAYVAGFMDALDVQNVTLVIHDWGSVLGLAWARQNPDRVKAVVFMEALVAPAFPMEDIEAFGPYADTFHAFRDPQSGPELLIKQNVFVEQVLPSSILRALRPQEMEAYRAPFVDEDTRLPLLMWPNELPISGEPARNVDVFEANNEWLMSSDTPKLLIYFEPGVLLPPEAAHWIGAHFRNTDIRFGGAGLHFVQEDQPVAIGRITADWLTSLAAN
ncbi:haloalkane dehalogenase [uncultured Tateyamaria sp.]|uniref:haloalkane dehalogenase n=1 Tax=uncultured Tateyamaria sp. TaxID=455651 RepID=UPI00261134C1|nr:haloalkane dehalogenase [uncultured Tateyamaria sp.]